MADFASILAELTAILEDTYDDNNGRQEVATDDVTQFTYEDLQRHRRQLRHTSNGRQHYSPFEFNAVVDERASADVERIRR